MNGANKANTVLILIVLLNQTGEFALISNNKEKFPHVGIILEETG